VLNEGIDVPEANVAIIVAGALGARESSQRLATGDFTLRHASGFSALVEVVGFYTPEYLRSKLAALRASASRPLIVCLDDSLACADGDVSGTVLRFKRRIDAAALVGIAEQLREIS
jgi:predicted nuclease of restriction endonuclease-like RecB superfamily